MYNCYKSGPDSFTSPTLTITNQSIKSHYTSKGHMYYKKIIYQRFASLFTLSVLV